MPMSEAELLAWRAKRLGKAVSTNSTPSDDRAPGALAEGRSPLSGYTTAATESQASEAPAFEQPAAPQRPAADPDAQAAIGRVAALQQQNAELQATVRAMQQQVAALQATQAEAETARTLAEAKRKAEAFDPRAGISEDEWNALDPLAQKVIEQTARNAHQSAMLMFGGKDPEELIRKTLAERDAAALKTFLRAASDSTGLAKLAHDQKFDEFLRQDDSADLLLTQFLNAPDLSTAQQLERKVKAMIGRFEKSTTPTRTTDASSSLGHHLSRTPGAGGSSAAPNKAAATTPEEARRIRMEANALSRQRKFKEARALLDSINN